jgi:hypothetical protein
VLERSLYTLDVVRVAPNIDVSILRVLDAESKIRFFIEALPATV